MRVPIFVSAKTADFSSRKQLLKGPALTLALQQALGCAPHGLQGHGGAVA
jgi:hypothetical protein